MTFSTAFRPPPSKASPGPLQFGRPILAEEDLAAERDLDALCRPFRAVGVCADLPVTCPYLAPPVPAPTEEDFKRIGLGKDGGAVRQIARWGQDAGDRVKG